MTPMIFRVYICQGPEKHVGHRPSVLNSADGSPLCRDCTWPVDEVEVVRVDEHPVLAVIERADEVGYEIELCSRPYADPPDRPCRIELRQGFGTFAGDRLATFRGASLDDCARVVSSNWPETKS
jgi:hypothetical protein